MALCKDSVSERKKEKFRIDFEASIDTYSYSVMDFDMVSFGILQPSTYDTLHNTIRHSSKKGLAVSKSRALWLTQLV